MLALSQILVALLGVYAVLGILFAIPFVIKGIGRLDPAAQDGTWGFRLLILPGVVALWPLLARRWLMGARQPPTECNPHRRAAREDAS